MLEFFKVNSNQPNIQKKKKPHTRLPYTSNVHLKKAEESHLEGSQLLDITF